MNAEKEGFCHCSIVEFNVHVHVCVCASSVSIRPIVNNTTIRQHPHTSSSSSVTSFSGFGRRAPGVPNDQLGYLDGLFPV